MANLYLLFGLPIRLAGGIDLMMSPARTDLLPTRSSLLLRLKDWQDQASWQEFFDTYWRLVYAVALKAGLSEAEAQDVVQETMLAVAQQMPGFKYDPKLGSFKNWLLNLTRWRITDQLRQRIPPGSKVGSQASAGNQAIDMLPDTSFPNLEEIWELEWQANLLEAATNNVKRRLDPQRYQLFDAYVNKGWAADKVAAALGVTVPDVYVAKHRITELLKKEVARLEKEVT